MSDRRSPFRRRIEIDAKVVLQLTGISLDGAIVDLSSSGARIVMTSGLDVGDKISLKLPRNEGFPEKGVEAEVSRTVFEPESGKHVHGVRFLSPLFDDGALLPCLRDKKLLIDRRGGVSRGVLDFPLKRRNYDYDVLMTNDPHWKFFEAFSQVKHKVVPHTVVVANNLTYLFKRIRSFYPEANIIPVGSLRETLDGPILVILSLDTRRKHEPFTFLDFDEYLCKRTNVGEPTRTLASLSRCAKGGAEIHLLSLCPIQNQRLAQKYLSVARLERFELISPHWVKVTKRPLYEKLFDDGTYTLREVEDQNSIEGIQAFAMRIFKGRYNFDLEIDGLFSSHSDFYGIYSNVTGELINFARVTHHLPGCFLPLMLASQVGSEKHIIMKDPDEICYGEVFSPYIRSLTAARVYSHLVRVIVSYGESGRVNTMFTTFEASDPKSLRFFSKYLGFADTNVTLRYGTFGGEWGLIFCSHRSFKESVELQLTSTLGAPRLISETVR